MSPFFQVTSNSWRRRFIDKVSEILTYLAALASELARRSTRKKYHILISGGAYMMLQGQQRWATDDTHFATIAPEYKNRNKGKPG